MSTENTFNPFIKPWPKSIGHLNFTARGEVVWQIGEFFFLIDSLVSHALSQHASLRYINQGFGSI